MPSKSVTFDDDQYGYILQTQDEDQSFSDRMREIIDAGIEAEESDVTFTCSHCGREFNNAGAKATHENNCQDAQE